MNYTNTNVKEAYQLIWSTRSALAGVVGGVGVGDDTVCVVVILPSLLTNALKEKIHANQLS